MKHLFLYSFIGLIALIYSCTGTSQATPQPFTDTAVEYRALIDSLQKVITLLQYKGETATRAAEQAPQDVDSETPAERAAFDSNMKANAKTYKGHPILTGPKGGKYYINSKGNKSYIPKG